MTPRKFIKEYHFDERMVKGSFYPNEPLDIEKGDKIGVVLFNLGGPENTGQIEPFLYNLFMDPAIIDLPIPGFLRHPLCQFIAKKRAAIVAKEYDLIGGGSPLNRHTEKQAELLADELNRTIGRETGVSFHTYIAMRYLSPSSEDAAAQMASDKINKVVLLPLYPQYSKTTTGASLVYWWLMEREGSLPKRPTVSVFEYAAHPKLISAINARIDEGLSRFPNDVRPGVQLLFSAHGTPVKEMKIRKDPYCCLIHATVERVMRARKYDHPHHVAFQSKVGPSEWLTPATPDKLKELATAGHENVLVVPVAFVSDHVETAFELNIEIRAEAEHAGIKLFEVANGLNDHPDFIEALTDVVGAHVKWDGCPKRMTNAKHARKTRCRQCAFNAEANAWTL